LGLRFVDISSQQVSHLENYIHDRALEPQAMTTGVL
jgi:hypothetical protein